MIHHSRIPNQSSDSAISLEQDATQFGHRKISGNIPSSGTNVTILAWALVFTDDTTAYDHYENIGRQLDTVGADGLIPEPIANIAGVRFGNMSERTGPFGDLTTIWVSSRADGGAERGAVLTRTAGALVQALTVDPYVALNIDRPTYLLESISIRMAYREQDLQLPPASDTMSRLPMLVDLFGLLTDARIDFNRYSTNLE